MITMDANRANRSTKNAPMGVNGDASDDQRDVPIEPERLLEKPATRPINAKRLPTLPAMTVGFVNLNFRDSRGNARREIIKGIKIIPIPKTVKNFSLMEKSNPVFVNKESNKRSEKARRDFFSKCMGGVFALLVYFLFFMILIILPNNNINCYRVLRTLSLNRLTLLVSFQCGFLATPFFRKEYLLFHL